MQSVILRVLQRLKGTSHARNDTQVSHYLGGNFDNNLLGEFCVLVEVSKKGKERVLIEDADVVGLVLVKDIAQV